MITKEELIKVLNDNSFSEDEINIFLSKRLSSLYKRGNQNNIDEIIKILKEKELLDSLKNCSTILTTGKAKKIKEIIKLLEEKELFDLLKKCPYILLQGKVKEIKEIIELLEEKELFDLLKNCPTILAKGKLKEINEIIELLEEKELFDLLKNCPTILARGKAKEINEIIKLLEEKELFDLLKKCPYILAQGKLKEINEIIELLEERELFDLLKNCPTILAQGKVKEIRNIINLLEEKDLLNLIKACPSILAQGKVKKIQEILEKLDTINGNIKNISLVLIIDYEKMNNIIDLKREDVSEEEFKSNLKNHLKLIGEYNKIYTKKDLIELSNKINISYDELLNNLFKYRNLIEDTLQNQKYIWFGESIPVTEEMLNDYSKEIVEIIDLVTKSFIKDNNFDYGDVHGFVMDNLIKYTGNIFINCGKTAFLKPILCKYLLKTCKRLYSNNLFSDFSKIENLRRYSSNDEHNYDFILNYSYLTEEEQYFLTRMSKHIEEQENYLELLSEEFCLTTEEVINFIENIKNKISKNDEDIKIKKYIKE